MDLTTQPLWRLGEVLHIKGIPIPYGAPQRGGSHRAVQGKPEEGVPEPLHLLVGRSPSSHRHGLHHLLQRRPAPSGNRGHTGVWPRLAEGDSFCGRAWPDQVRGTPGAWWASPRLPTRRIAQPRSKSLRLPHTGPVMPGHAPKCRIPTSTGHDVPHRPTQQNLERISDRV